MKAVAFDMDGVIVDSERQWKLSEGGFFRDILGSWDDADHRQIVGLGVVDLYYWMVRERKLAMTKEAFLARCETVALDIYQRRTTLTPGAGELITDLRRRGVRLGLASSSPRNWIDITLDRFALRDAFEAVVSGDDVPGRTKPEPDIYLRCAGLLGALPADCVAIEDSAIGVLAAKRAGLRCVGFRSGFNDEQDLTRADWEARGFSALSYESLVSRLAAV